MMFLISILSITRPKGAFYPKSSKLELFSICSLARLRKASTSLIKVTSIYSQELSPSQFLNHHPAHTSAEPALLG